MNAEKRANTAILQANSEKEKAEKKKAEYNNLIAIVVGATDAQNNNKKYGLVNSRGEVLIGCVLDKIYSVRTSGQDIYYMEQIKNEQTTVRRNVIEWLQQNGKQKPSASTDNNNNANANANTVTSSQGQTSTQNQTSTLPMTNETKPVVKQNGQ